MEDHYRKIRMRNLKRWGEDRFRTANHFGREAHYGASDLLAELVQNAEDAGARRLGFRILDHGLLIWNDGRPFDNRDVESITGLLISGKESSAIGYFGVGFKAVLVVTMTPCVLSGSHRFWLKGGLDPYPLGAESDDGEASPKVPYLSHEIRHFVDQGAVFWLPWRDTKTRKRLTQEFEDIRNRLEDYLLFLNNLQTLELDGDCYEVTRSERTLYSQVVLLKAPDGIENRFLRICWTAYPPRKVIEKVLSDLEPDDERRRRWDENAPKSLFGIAVRLDENNEPKETDGRVFVYLPTEELSGFRFHIQGRMKLTGDRKRVIPDNPLTQWVLEEFRKNAQRFPEWFRNAGMFPRIWQVFPKKGEVEEPWISIAESLENALRKGDFFNGEDGGFYPPEQVLLAHRRELYDLLSNKDLEEITGRNDVKWIHPELRDGRARDVVRSLGVDEVERNRVIAWLETKTEPKWWETRDKSWLSTLYRYLDGIRVSAGRKEAREILFRLKHLPLARLRHGQHVLPMQAVFPPEDSTTVPETLRPELYRLPVIDDDLAREFRALLHECDVRDFHVEILIERMLERYYEKPPYPPAEENCRHIRLMFNLRNNVSRESLEKWGQRWPILRSEDGNYVKPVEAYLPEELGGIAEMRTYIRMAGGRPIVVSDYYHESHSKDEWRNFLEIMGCASLPRVMSIPFEWDDKTLPEAVRVWCAAREIAIPERASQSTRGWIGLDWKIDGLEEILNRWAQKPPMMEEAHALWVIGSKLSENKYSARGAGSKQYEIPVSRSALTWFYYYEDKCEGLALWILRLRKIPWLPDEQGNLRRPGELFDIELKKFLPSEGFFFLHDEFCIKKNRIWARLLDIRTEADVKDVCRALCERLELGAGPEEIQQVYKWLEQQCEDERKRKVIRDQFERHALILVPGVDRFRCTEVCWEDPTGILPEIRPHWEAFRHLFLEFLDVPDRPNADVIARFLLESIRSEKDPREWKRVAREIERRWNEISGKLRKELREVQWPGIRGGNREWRLPRELCITDDTERARLLENKITCWEMKDLEELAVKLGVKRVSDAVPCPHPEGELGENHKFFGELKRLWDAICWFAKGSGEIPKLRQYPPAVKKTRKLWITYQWDGIESDRVLKAAGLDIEGWTLWSTEIADVWDIGDAFEDGLKISRFREFLKDIWDINDEHHWERMLKRWMNKLGMDTLPELPSTGSIDNSGIMEDLITPTSDKQALRTWDVFIGKPRFEAHSSSQRSTGISRSQMPQGQLKSKPDSARQLPRDEGFPENEYQPSVEELSLMADLAKTAVENAKQWLRIEGFHKIVNVSEYGLGYDLEAYKDDEVRYVEVKGLSQPGPVEMTWNEWATAKEKGDTYWLYIYVKTERRGWPINNPADRLEAQKIKKVVTYFRIKDWR